MRPPSGVRPYLFQGKIMAKQIFTFGVDGASPGFNGVVVVLAVDPEQAYRAAQEEIKTMNASRMDRGYSSEVSLGDPLTDSRRIPKNGVVYSYDGEG